MKVPFLTLDNLESCTAFAYYQINKIRNSVPFEIFDVDINHWPVTLSTLPSQLQMDLRDREEILKVAIWNCQYCLKVHEELKPLLYAIDIAFEEYIGEVSRFAARTRKRWQKPMDRLAQARNIVKEALLHTEVTLRVNWSVDCQYRDMLSEMYIKLNAYSGIYRS